MGQPTPVVLTVLRAEAAGVVVAMSIVAWHLGPPWWLVVLVLVAPDLSLTGYTRGPRVGAAVYNAAHTYVGPLVVAGVWLVSDNRTAGEIAALWALHIGVDRALGFGLKLPAGFGETHLGKVGRR